MENFVLETRRSRGWLEAQISKQLPTPQKLEVNRFWHGLGHQNAAIAPVLHERGFFIGIAAPFREAEYDNMLVACITAVTVYRDLAKMQWL